jgi:hypothetical protein
MYQNPTNFDNDISFIEFDRKANQGGNHYVTWAEWTDKYGETHVKSIVSGEEIPDHIRLQIALQIAGDLIQPIQK